MKSVSMIYEFRGLSHMGVSSLRILTVLSNLVLLGEYTGSVGNVQRFGFSSSPWMVGRATSFAARLPWLHLGQKEGTTSQQVRSIGLRNLENLASTK
jgi:hypothetical protein